MNLTIFGFYLLILRSNKHLASSKGSFRLRKQARYVYRIFFFAAQGEKEYAINKNTSLLRRKAALRHALQVNVSEAALKGGNSSQEALGFVLYRG